MLLLVCSSRNSATSPCTVTTGDCVSELVCLSTHKACVHEKKVAGISFIHLVLLDLVGFCLSSFPHTHVCLHSPAAHSGRRRRRGRARQCVGSAAAAKAPTTTTAVDDGAGRATGVGEAERSNVVVVVVVTTAVAVAVTGVGVAVGTVDSSMYLGTYSSSATAS
jgi:hypothetical protein